jgi:alcohol dehydrogenase (NADP+)
MVNADTFEGWAGLSDKACEGEMEYQEFQPKPFDEDDVDIKVIYCGICGSDVSALSGEWGPVEGKQQICGHEIVGEVIRVGLKVENGLKFGSVVGIGAQSDSCRECESCQAGEENFCQKSVSTGLSSLIVVEFSCTDHHVRRPIQPG